MRNLKRNCGGALLLSFALSLNPGAASAQSVIFPQEQQAGKALAEVEDNTYSLSNDLLTAKFVKNGDHLVFGGCEEMNLKPGDELFRVVLGDGTTVNSSEMTLGDVKIVDLTPDTKAAKGSLKLNGKAIEAEFTHGKLSLKWRAVLRDGSHYLRTELDLKANGDQAMKSITPMIYTVDNEKAKSAPVVVGNTRGAILASDKIFAGLETPMGINTSGSSDAEIAGFTPSWTENTFTWTPGNAVPSEVLALKNESGADITADMVGGVRYAIYFREAGKHTLTFNYKQGTHKLNILGVDIADGMGNATKGDYHLGHTGNANTDNAYVVDVPKAGAYVLRIFVDKASETITSQGRISIDKDYSVPVVVYDLVEGSQPEADVKSSVPMTRLKQSISIASADDETSAYRQIIDRTRWTVTADGWQNDNAAGWPEAIIDGDNNTYWHSWYQGTNPANGASQAMPHWFMVDMQAQKRVSAVGFTTRQDKVDVNGHIKEYEIWCGNSTTDLKKVTSGTLTYSLGQVWVDLPETTECRYIKVNIKSSQNGAAFACVAEFNAAEELPAGGLQLNGFETYSSTWQPSTWQQVEEKDVPLRVGELGHYYPNVYKSEQTVTANVAGGTLSSEFDFAGGTNRLQIVGMDLIDESNNVVANDYHFGYTGNQKSENVYSIKIPYTGSFTLRYLVSMKDEQNTSNGNISLSYSVADTLHMLAPTSIPISGQWNRNTTLKNGKTWNVSSVVGLIAPGQARRSVLAYSERERAVPWRAYPVYISWYELNIDRNNATAASGYKGNMTVEQCTDVVENWKKSFYNVYDEAPMAFVWDDGWDEYGTWTFNPNFPNGFKEPAEVAAQMGTGIGAWLGPVGGYGTSGNYRRQYWQNKGGMQLSNQAYYDFFVAACNNMIDNYDFRFFKYDGISAQFSATGPDAGTTGEENAEAIIQIERDIRQKKPDIFLNTTVGTWASPFWFQFTDAVWRQEQDYGTIGNQGSDRERWITYRDRLVYQNFVQNSPLCPINTLMTHGFILTKFGAVSKDMNYDGIVRELRCAFACGSGMVELYNDYSLMNSIKGKDGKAGALWKDLAECIKWQRDNADVLPDAHWVGGNPWDGAKANVYGWASWNSAKATLALRNPAASAQTYTTTLRKALDIPAYINTTITLSNSFSQPTLEGIETGKPINIDEELTIKMPASSVFVFDGKDNNPTVSITEPKKDNTELANATVYDLGGRKLPEPSKGINIVGGKKIYKK